MERFQPPANVGDFSRSQQHEQALREAWDDRIGGVVRNLVRETDATGASTYPRIFNPLDAPTGVTPVSRTISWQGFPRFIEAWLNLSDQSTPDEYIPAFRAAEQLRQICVANVTYVRGGQTVTRRQEPRDAVPGTVLQMFPIDAGRVVVERAFALEERVQDEYLEWHVTREEGKVTGMTFTAEGPEYWDVLAAHDRDLLVQLYRDHVDPNVRVEDLYWDTDLAGPALEVELTTGRTRHTGFTRFNDFQRGRYNPYNIWNTRRGCMHLIQRNNTLSAELRLAADATRRYALRPNTATPVNRFDLCACAGYGAINRNSDPSIGFGVNGLALSDLAVTVSNPIGLYIGDIQLDGVRGPDGTVIPKDQLLTVERGDPSPPTPRVLRFSVRPPADSSFGLEQCTLATHALAFGGAVALQTSIVIHGEAIPRATANAELGCDGKACAHPDRPQYRVVVGPNQACSDIDWASVAPPVPIDVPEMATTRVEPQPASGTETRGLPMRGLR